MAGSATDTRQLDGRTQLAEMMVQTLPAFGEWATAVRDFETPQGKIGYRQLEVLYALRYHLISPDDVSPSQMAEHYRVQPSAITRVLNRLEAGGFIARTIDPHDGRGQNIQITDRGVSISILVEDLFIREMLDAISSLDETEVDDLRKGVELLVRIVGELGKHGLKHSTVTP